MFSIILITVAICIADHGCRGVGGFLLAGVDYGAASDDDILAIAKRVLNRDVVDDPRRVRGSKSNIAVIRQIVRFDATVLYALALDEDGIAAVPGGP